MSEPSPTSNDRTDRRQDSRPAAILTCVLTVLLAAGVACSAGQHPLEGWAIIKVRVLDGPPLESICIDMACREFEPVAEMRDGEFAVAVEAGTRFEVLRVGETPGHGASGPAPVNNCLLVELRRDAVHYAVGCEPRSETATVRPHPTAPPDDADEPSDDPPVTTVTNALDDTSGLVTPTGGSRPHRNYSSPTVDLPLDGDRTLPVEAPLVDGVYYSSAVRSDGSTVMFRLGQWFGCDDSGVPDEPSVLCRSGFGTLDQPSIDVPLAPDATITIATGDLDAPTQADIDGSEFARLVNGDDPSVDAPAGFRYRSSLPIFVEIDDGHVIAAEQFYIS